MSPRAKRPLEPVRRYAYTRKEAAKSLGMSVDTFERKVQPHVRVIPCGQLVLVPPAELERWVRERAQYLVEAARERR
jgi:excisionase family DNA binding protein